MNEIKPKLLIIGCTSYLARNFISRYSRDFCIVGVTRKKQFESNGCSEIIVTSHLNCPSFLTHVSKINAKLVLFTSHPDAKTSELMKNNDLEEFQFSLSEFARWCKNENFKRFVYVSTIHVYGKSFWSNSASHKFIKRPDTVYSRSHSTNEDRLLEIFGSEGSQIKVLRLANAFGGQLTKTGKNLVINEFCTTLRMGKEITINSINSELRNFVPIKFVISQLKKELIGKSDINFSTSTDNIFGCWLSDLVTAKNFLEKRYNWLIKGQSDQSEPEFFLKAHWAIDRRYNSLVEYNNLKKYTLRAIDELLVSELN